MTEYTQVTAFCPGHISGYFRPYITGNSLTSGSIGAGVVIDSGVVVTATTAEKTTVQILQQGPSNSLILIAKDSPVIRDLLDDLHVTADVKTRYHTRYQVNPHRFQSDLKLPVQCDHSTVFPDPGDHTADHIHLQYHHNVTAPVVLLLWFSSQKDLLYDSCCKCIDLKIFISGMSHYIVSISNAGDCIRMIIFSANNIHEFIKNLTT